LQHLLCLWGHLAGIRRCCVLCCAVLRCAMLCMAAAVGAGADLVEHVDEGLLLHRQPWWQLLVRAASSSNSNRHAKDRYTWVVSGPSVFCTLHF